MRACRNCMLFEVLLQRACDDVAKNALPPVSLVSATIRPSLGKSEFATSNHAAEKLCFQIPVEAMCPL